MTIGQFLSDNATGLFILVVLVALILRGGFD